MPPALALLPDVVVDQTTSLPVMFDLWALASDAETADDDLDYFIWSAPPAGAGVTISGNRWLIVDPSTSWCGSTDVTIGVSDPGLQYDSDTFRVAVTWSCQG
jgi:hypothetical protein